MKITKKKTISTDYLLEAVFRRVKSFVQFHILAKKVTSKHTTVFERFEEIN
tara:strand:+ start:404 stop:556 length:153 start_codon:yes stop_codon:yes gene_type:complete